MIERDAARSAVCSREQWSASAEPRGADWRPSFLLLLRCASTADQIGMAESPLSRFCASRDRLRRAFLSLFVFPLLSANPALRGSPESESWRMRSGAGSQPRPMEGRPAMQPTEEQWDRCEPSCERASEEASGDSQRAPHSRSSRGSLLSLHRLSLDPRPSLASLLPRRSSALV